MRAWYVVNTLPHQEARADQNLRRQNYTTLLPVTRRTRRHARRLDTVLTPLFPGYLFVELDLETQSWSSINSTFGVKRLLCGGDRPTELQRDFVDSPAGDDRRRRRRERAGARTAARPAGAHLVGAVRRLHRGGAASCPRASASSCCSTFSVAASRQPCPSAVSCRCRVE